MVHFTQGDNHRVRSSSPPSPSAGPLAPETAEFYRRMLHGLLAAELPFLVGGAYALARYTGIERHTKDLDVFVTPENAPRALELLGALGCSTELSFPHWLGKAWLGDDFLDVIFSSGNGIADVDDEWFDHAVEETVLGVPVVLVPPEEMLWSKAFVMERERFDGSDINHLLLRMGSQLDWERLLRRFGKSNVPVLLAHVALFRFAYPSHAQNVPDAVFRELCSQTAQITREDASELTGVCRGTILSRQQYLIDIEEWGYRDGRLVPYGPMSDEEIAAWTAAIDSVP